MSKIQSIQALQILDSRGVPTVKVYVTTASGVTASASVPSGASKGIHEALELRDGSPLYFGKSVTRVIEHIEGPLAQGLQGFDVQDQYTIDQRMIELDGTDNKSKLGANAVLGISMAVARAAASERAVPLYLHLASLSNRLAPPCLPCPMLNIINGGAHANNNLNIQEFMIRPIAAPTFREALRWSCEIYGHLKMLLQELHLACGVGDEGGFAPCLKDDEEALKIIVRAIERAGLRSGDQVSLALDCAASEFYQQGYYSDKKQASSIKRSAQEQIDLLQGLVERYPIDSIEDGLAEEDWEGFVQLTARLGAKCQIIGDDLLVTNPIFVKQAIQRKAVSGVLIKLNQIGTVCEVIEVMELAYLNRLKTIISHRSGETEDTFIADLVVGTGSGQFKAGAPCRGERTAKYNRLLEIEAKIQAPH